MKIWKDHKNSETQKLLDYMLSIWLKDGGFNFTAKNEIAYHEFLYSIEAKELNRSAVHKTLTKMNSNSKTSLDDFSKIYDKIKKDLLKEKPILNKWIFYIPFKADFDKNLKFPISLTVLDIRFQFVDKIPFHKKLIKSLPFRLYKYQQEIKEQIAKPKLKFLSVVGYGQNWNSAWKNISLSLDVLRGIIEFSFSFRGFMIGSESKPRSTIPHPKWVVIRDYKNDFDGTTFNIHEYSVISKFKFQSKHIRIIKNNSRLIQRIPEKNNSKQLLISCMRIYSDAMDAYFHHNQFLGLWNIAEAICLSSEFGGESKKVASRLAWFGQDIGLVSSGYSNILENLALKRNELVHKGISNIRDEEINHLKFAVDTALLWLYGAIQNFKTIQHLSNYYRLKETSKVELKALRETISVINKAR